MLLDEVKDTLTSAVRQCLALQNENGSWCGEVRSNTTFTAQFVFLCDQIRIPLESTNIEQLKRWILSQQKPDGSWGLGPGCEGDVSTTTETYLALKMLGLSIHDARMMAARKVVLSLGGLPSCRMFTRVFLASYGLIPWSALPSLPPELIMLPSSIPINIYHMASWARATCVPLLLIRHHEPVYPLPNGLGAIKNNPYLDELWDDSIKREFTYGRSFWDLCSRVDIAELFFQLGDSVLSTLGRYFSSPIRKSACRKVLDWILSHQEASGEWAGYWPPQHNNIWALSLEGYSLDHPAIRHAVAGINSFIRQDSCGMRIQVTISQVWDTALMGIALNDAAASQRNVEALSKRPSEY